MITLIRNGSIVTSEGLKLIDLLFQDDKIIEMGHHLTGYDQVIEATDCFVIPGMIDIHVHGGGGHDFMEASLEAFEKATDFHLKNGATSIVPTAISASKEAIDHFLMAYKTALNTPSIQARLIGAHLEGPYLSKDKKGAHPLKYLRNPDINEYSEWVEKFPFISRMTAAPELEGALDLGDFLSQKGVNVSIGHSNAYGHTIIEAMNHGYKSVTHLYNAMSNVGQVDGKKEAGVAEMALLEKDLYVELIADLKHVPSELIKLAYLNKTADRLILVSDCLSPAGMGEGQFFLGTEKEPILIDVKDAAYLHNQSVLAGSISSVNQLLKNVMSLGIDFIDAVKMLSLTPAKLLKLDHIIGSIEINKCADIVILDNKYNVLHVICQGKQIR